MKGKNYVVCKTQWHNYSNTLSIL